jgi:hypothetical protein
MIGPRNDWGRDSDACVFGDFRRQPPKSFVDSEDNQEDPSEPNPLLD